MTYSIADDVLEDLAEGDFPNLQILLDEFDQRFFQTRVAPRYRVEWSARLTRCAGICDLTHKVIRLSEPLLRYRSVRDLKSTLLHEMIHAYLWESGVRGQEGPHGRSFRRLAADIGAKAGVPITCTHSFYQEVNEVRRIKNRPTSPALLPTRQWTNQSVYQLPCSRPAFNDASGLSSNENAGRLDQEGRRQGGRRLDEGGREKTSSSSSPDRLLEKLYRETDFKIEPEQPKEGLNFGSNRASDGGPDRRPALDHESDRMLQKMVWIASFDSSDAVDVGGSETSRVSLRQSLCLKGWL